MIKENNKELEKNIRADKKKIRELTDDELDAVSGGSFASNADYLLAQRYQVYLFTSGEASSFGQAGEILKRMLNDKEHSYTSEDYRAAIKKELGIEIPKL